MFDFIGATNGILPEARGGNPIWAKQYRTTMNSKTLVEVYLELKCETTFWINPGYPYPKFKDYEFKITG